MSRRKVWGSLALVVAVLVGVSMLSNGRAPAWTAQLVAAMESVAERAAVLPWWAAPAAGVAVGLILVLAIRRRRRARAVSAPESGQQFDDLLEAAIDRSGDPRRIEVARLARNGSPLGRISRETRLARDAVRTVIGTR